MEIINTFRFKLLAVALLLSALSFSMLYPYMALPIAANDKVLHWVAFFSIGVVLLGPLSVERKSALILLVTFSVVLEFGQLFIRQRDADILDLGANFVGVFCAFSIFSIGAFSQRFIAQKQHVYLYRKLRRHIASVKKYA